MMKRCRVMLSLFFGLMLFSLDGPKLFGADGICSYTCDDFQVIAIQDMAGPLSASKFSGGDEAVNKSLAPSGKYQISYSAFIVCKDNHLILIDAGNGPKTGTLMQKLKTLEIKPEEIDTVLLTHSHGDHVAGLRTKDDRPAFPNATVYLSEPELKYWRSNSPKKDPLAGYQVHTFKFGDKTVGGILCRNAAGHSPGQTCFELGKFLFIGDMFHVAELQIPYPEFVAPYDSDKKQTVACRKECLELCKRDGYKMVGDHFPFWFLKKIGFTTNDVKVKKKLNR
ncbi:MAG: MBL fold metallo-hydrolase [Thermoguttaceae bacterium]|nr:MBL fold metallo-hydrolase [Thermoguttaceae bacterium]